MIQEAYYDFVHRFRTAATSLITNYPTIRTPLYRLRDRCAKLVVDTACFSTRLRHEAPTDPYQIFWIDPDEITASISWQELSIDRGEEIPEAFTLPNYHFAGRIKAGDWDTDRRQFTDSVIYRSFRAHFEDDIPWKETDLYEQALAVIDHGGSPWGCTSPEDLDQRCQEIDRLYDTVGADGYKTQAELLESGVHPFDHARPNQYTQTVDGEIALTVGRDGELLFYDGRNRLAIAKLLGLDSIPVVILVRHRQWQQLRDAVAGRNTALASLPERLQSHPDLVGLSPSA
jgi:hypothetical protein